MFLIEKMTETAVEDVCEILSKIEIKYRRAINHDPTTPQLEPVNSNMMNVSLHRCTLSAGKGNCVNDDSELRLAEEPLIRRERARSEAL